MLKPIMKFLKKFFNSVIQDCFNDIYWYGVFIFSAFLSGIVAANIDDIKIAHNIILGIFIIVFVIAFRFRDKG
ncbi:Uncharacterised protein [Enterobacter hormaechei]|uniref:Uncharacterized protein n=1 Tax=Enterobacter hormaechei subsp. steigerwaltii TaxID=299766 RepID=A0AAE4J2J0_9ENTR|nr:MULTISPECIES: hypothetical protein [Enterobacter]CAE7306935.1 hypothetical protein AI2656V1_1555 [Enterobacter cloacae]VAL63906.1 Uncharacterised protein [Enterobacter kobei]AWV76816.1 hypothetical protein DN066_15975 [Enterobacter hormaechei subsp. xiangfangensis]EHF5060916.1 hypothetical protein [Enterobacter hormaechei]EKV5135579.1 hypothetical protein [Enterobacter hormaechei]